MALVDPFPLSALYGSARDGPLLPFTPCYLLQVGFITRHSENVVMPLACKQLISDKFLVCPVGSFLARVLTQKTEIMTR